LRSPGASRPASQLSLEDVLDRHVLQRELGIHPLQLRVLTLELLDALELGDRGARILRAPQEVGRSADAVAAQQVRHRDPRLTLLQDRDDLLLRESRLPHAPSRIGPGSLACRGSRDGEAYAVISTLRHQALPAGDTTGNRAEPSTWKTPGSRVATTRPRAPSLGFHSADSTSPSAGGYHSRPPAVVG